MIVRSALGATLLAAAMSLASLSIAAPASAASLMTDAFLTNANQDIDFLDRASRFALTNSKSAKIKTFAHDQARDQTLTANKIDEWIQADLGPQAGGDKLATGRSVAVDGSASPEARKMAAMTPPVGQEDLDNLEGLNGKDFDDIYKARGQAALEQLRDLYAAYAATGDDATLVAIANRELPKIKRQIVELGRL